MRRLFIVLLTCLAATLAQAAPPRAIWIWEAESFAMLDQRAAADSALDFFDQHGISNLFLYADAFQGRNPIADDPARVRQLIKRVHGEGKQVYALLGSAYLNTERYILPSRRAAALAMVRRVLDYNAAAAADERFDGINLDIEPHLLDEWPAQKFTLLKNFLDMSAAIMALKRASGQRLQIGPAIPFWWDGIVLDWQGRKRPVSEHTQDLYDYVALMDYRDHAAGGDGMIGLAADEMAYGAAIGKRVLLGVETTPNDIQKVSFDHLAPADMERELAAAAAHFAASPAFGGFVIHHYRGYRRWLERPRP